MTRYNTSVLSGNIHWISLFRCDQGHLRTRIRSCSCHRPDHVRNAEARNPVRKPPDTIECRDATLTRDSLDPKWPTTNIVIGNPLFMGGKPLITHLSENYVSLMVAM